MPSTDVDTQPNILETRDVVKSYPGVRAVDHVTFSVRSGEVHGLVGENGAGKSTLIRILAGATRMDRGEIWLDGRRVEIDSVHTAKQLGLAFIHQELNLVPYFDAAENIFLGHAYPRTRFGNVAWKELRRRASDLLAQLGADLPVDAPVRRLSPGQQTMIAIAHAFAASARVVVMDEPTAALTDQEIEHLFTVIRALRRQGTSIIYVSHRLQEIFEIADRVTVMRNGRVVTTQNTAQLDRAGLVQRMTGHSMEIGGSPRYGEIGDVLLWVEGLTGSRVGDASFSLHAGEVLGVAGLMGSGRSELLRLIFGAERARSGNIWVSRPDAAPVHFTKRTPKRAFSHGIALVPEERRTQGLILGRPIFENITLPHLARVARGGILLDRKRERDLSERLGERLDLRAANVRQPVSQLSGGNQQKVVFARAMAGRTNILLLDEPTRGVDVGAKQEIYQIIRSLTAEGAGVLLVSSELPELLSLSDRILVLHEGRQMVIVDAAEADQQMVLAGCYGLEMA